MIRYKLRALVSQWEFERQRRLPWTELSEATGIARTSLSKMSGPKPFNTTLANIDALCRFFGCRVEDLLEYVADPVPASSGVDAEPAGGVEGRRRDR